MDPFIIFIKHSCQEMNVYSLEDVALLKCVSKEIKTELGEIYQNKEKVNELCKNTCKQLGCIRVFLLNYVGHSILFLFYNVL